MPEEIPESTTTEVSARSLLVDWANAQDHWIRALVKELLTSPKELPESRVDHFYDLLLREKELKDSDVVSTPELSYEAGTTGPDEALILEQLGDVQNVNLLAPGQTIDFNPELTVLFGENAAGKTGYVRILKRLSAVRLATEILPDIKKLGAAPTPKARISYKLGPHSHIVDWNNEEGLHPFQRVDIFDAESAQIHVDEDLMFVYTPTDLSLFSLVHQAADRVKGRLEEARASHLPTRNPFLEHFSKGTKVYTRIETLGPSTSLGELAEFAAVTPEEEAGLKPLADKVDALGSGDLDSRIQAAEAQRTLREKALDATQTIADFDSGAYEKAVDSLATAKEQHEQTTKEAFSGEPIPAVLGEAWKKFITAGEAYLEELDAKDYPSEGESCIYCRQSLTAAAAQLVTKYRDFCSSELKKKLDEAARHLSGLTARVCELQLENLSTDLDSALAALAQSGHDDVTLTELKQVLALAKELQQRAKKDSVIEDPKVCVQAGKLSAKVSDEISKTTSLLSDLRAESEKRKETLAQASAELEELKARLTLRRFLPQIKEHVDNQKWADKAKILLKRFQGLFKSLTDKSKEASEQLLNRDFEKLFGEERENLRAPKVTLDFPGKRGQPARRKFLTDKHKLSEILSEGEQKVIALADFLAETQLNRKSTPIVFDDPVNSLDYKRLEYVAQRVCQLSEKRQVVVFSHNIWFVCELLARYEKKPKACSYYDVTDKGEVKGIITRGNHPRQDTLKSLRGRINELKQQAGAAAGAAQSALVEKAYGVMRSFCEVFVQDELFQGVIRRYEPNVRMTTLPHIKVERLPDAIKTVVPIFDKCCRYMDAHSQPLETLSVRPKYDEFVEDWDKLRQAHEAYSAK